MTCRNVFNNVIIGFEKKWKFPLGKIKYIPKELFYKLAAEPRGDSKMAKLVMDVEEVFLRAYIERDFEK